MNAVIRNSFGAPIAHADLVYADAHVLIEYDGGVHWGNARQFAVDIRRLDEVMAEGWRVIRAALEQSGWTP